MVSPSLCSTRSTQISPLCSLYCHLQVPLTSHSSTVRGSWARSGSDQQCCIAGSHTPANAGVASDGHSSSTDVVGAALVSTDSSCRGVVAARTVVAREKRTTAIILRGANLRRRERQLAFQRIRLAGPLRAKMTFLKDAPTAVIDLQNKLRVEE